VRLSLILFYFYCYIILHQLSSSCSSIFIIFHIKYSKINTNQKEKGIVAYCCAIDFTIKRKNFLLLLVGTVYVNQKKSLSYCLFFLFVSSICSFFVVVDINYQLEFLCAVNLFFNNVNYYYYYYYYYYYLIFHCNFY
jgi:hypothetical protein